MRRLHLCASVFSAGRPSVASPVQAATVAGHSPSPALHHSSLHTLLFHTLVLQNPVSPSCLRRHVTPVTARHHITGGIFITDQGNVQFTGTCWLHTHFMAFVVVLLAPSKTHRGFGNTVERSCVSPSETCKRSCFKRQNVPVLGNGRSSLLTFPRFLFLSVSHRRLTDLRSTCLTL